MALNAPRGRTTDARRSPLLTRPGLERLEDRTTPTTVTTLADSGAGSLRNAIAATAAGGIVDFAPGLAGDIVLTSQIDIPKNLTIVGPGVDGNTNSIVRISGNNLTRIFNITNNLSPTITVAISKLELINGKAFDSAFLLGNGGAIQVSNEIVTLTDVTIRASRATGSGTRGGAIATGPGSQLTLNRSIISGNDAASDGGGLYLGQGSFNIIRNSTISGNRAIGGSGGGVYIDIGAELTLEDTTVSGNTAGNGSGGGVYHFQGDSPTSLLIRRSTISGNSATGTGGGVYFDGGSGGIGQIVVENSTISGNKSTLGSGGGLYLAAFGGSGGVAIVRNSTIYDNRAAGFGGGIASSIQNTSVLNSTLALNVADTNGDGKGLGGGFAQLAGASAAKLNSTLLGDNRITSTSGPANDADGALAAEFCLIEAPGSAVITGANNVIGKDPALGVLQNNGGPTLTVAPNPGSPAIDKGSGFYTPPPPPTPDTDQRGVGFNRVINGRIDIGAYEYQPPATVTILTSTINPAEVGDPISFVASVAGTAKNSNTVSGTVQFFVDGQLARTANLVDGSAVYTTSFSTLGPRVVEARYSGFSGFTGDPVSDVYRFDPSSGTLLQEVVVLPPPPPPPNTPPRISDIPDRVIDANTSTGAIAFTVADTETPATNLTLSVATSDAAILPVSGIAFGGTANNRTITVTPAAGRTGSATLTVTVTDGDGLSVSDSFIVTILPVVPPPPPPPPPPPLPPLPPPPVVGLFAVGTGPGDASQVAVFNADGSPRFNFAPFTSSFIGGVRVATGDLTGDRIDDVVVGAGAGGGPHVKVFDGVTGAEVGNFFAFDPSFAGGVNLAVGDVNGDGFADIVVGAGIGGAPHVRALSGVTFAGNNPQPPQELANYFAFDRRFRGGVSVAVGDLDGDFVAEIIAGAGPQGGPHVKAFDARTESVRLSFFAYDPSFAGGVTVAAGDLDGDGRADIATGTQSGGAPHVKVYNGSNGAVRASFFAYESEFRGGVSVGINNSPNQPPTLLTGTGVGGAPLVRGLTNFGATERFSFFAFDSELRGGVFVG